MSGSVGDSLPAPDAETAGPPHIDRAGLVRAYGAARAAGDLDGMTAAAMGLAARQPFGTYAGRIPAFLHGAYALARGEQRARLAVAIARAWAYGGDPERAAGFAAEALAAAEKSEDPSLLAAALDVQLLVHWGPDAFDQRIRLTARLENTVAHLVDVQARLSAHLWRLTTALECLDPLTALRQLRALNALAEESGSPRIRFFARSRQAMYALVSGRLDEAERAMREAVSAGVDAGEVDAYAIERTLTAGIARQADDIETLAREAASHEDFGVREGVVSIAAEGASLWLAAGHPERGAALLHQLAGGDFGRITRDVDWLLTVASLTEVAAATGETSLAEKSLLLLEPYAGRGVVNGGGVAFVGVVDDYLHQACTLLGRDDDARGWAASAAHAYENMGASWWHRRLSAPTSTPGRSDVVHLRPGGEGIWWVGREGAVTPLRDVKGLHYLRLVLARSGVDVSAVDLSDAVAGHPGTGPVGGSAGELLDRQALDSYRRRLAEIDSELDEAASWSDSGRVAKLEDERDVLLRELRTAVGLGGRRRASGATNERARVAVRKAMTTAIHHVSSVDPSLGRLLSDRISTGSTCRYDPDPDRPTHWVLSS